MPVDIIKAVISEGTDVIPAWDTIKTVVPPLVGLSLIKYYFGGSTNTWDRDLHGKVFIVTGGTSGIGNALVRDLAFRGAQLIILSSQLDESNGGTVWLQDYIEDLRNESGNLLIYTEPCDLSSLYSVRKFATKWLDNSPPRRLDGVICLAAESAPIGNDKKISIDGIERQVAINYLGHYHLLTLLEPSLKVQPPDRDVRVILSSCLSQSFAQINYDDLLSQNEIYPKYKPWKLYSTSKLLLSMFALEYQRRILSFTRKDGAPCNVRINIVNPGVVRTPSTRRVLTFGSLFGLLIYLILYPIVWLFLKSPEQGMQSYLYSLFSPEFADIQGGKYIKECSIIAKPTRPELSDSEESLELQKQVFESTKTLVEQLERNSAIARNSQKGAKKPTKKEVKEAKEEEKKRQTRLQKNMEQAEVFTSAFQQASQEANSLFPNNADFNKMGDTDTRNDRLKSLDKKYEMSRKSQVETQPVAAIEEAEAKPAAPAARKTRKT